MNIAQPTELIRARVTQEVRIILPPCGQRVEYDPLAPCQAPISEAWQRVLIETGFDDVAKVEAQFGCPVLRGSIYNYMRKVQILVPPSPGVLFGVDVDPVSLGPNRGNYKLPPLPSGQTIKLRLMPEQFLVAVADDKTALLGLIVEYYERTEP